MNAVEIEEAISQLAEAPFDPEEFPFAFLEAFGEKSTTIKRLKQGATNASDLEGVLQRNKIHIKVCPQGEVTATLTALRESRATAKHKVKFILATDGQSFEAENLIEGETVACEYAAFSDHFGFFLPLAGITTVRQIRENAFDIKATSRLNRLYVELLKENPDWDTAEKREAFNHFMARLIFCFFAEDTNIFPVEGMFTSTVATMSAGDSSNTHEVLAEVFRSMATPLKKRSEAKIRKWADQFPYVNGGLFSGSDEVPRFSKIARSYLLHVGSLDWTKINPDIFGSMIQAVADEDERGALGMHYTSVPNILKVLNPLFLDDLREQLEAAGDNSRKLLNLRQRITKIRVFDPACGSGNFLVIAYKEMRAIEAEINKRRGEADRQSDIPLTNFRGIEIRHFATEIARLALIIAEYQCDVLYRGPRLALAEFLPLKAENWIICGNALRLDWLSVCPPEGTGVKLVAEDLFSTPLDQAEIDFENAGGETYICGNPPYLGSQWRNQSQQQDMDLVFSYETKSYKDLDYVAAWYLKAAEYCSKHNADCALVATKTICQGIQVAMLWPLILKRGLSISFAYRPFTWGNLAKDKAGVTCVIVGLSKRFRKPKRIFEDDAIKEAHNIGPYLIDMPDLIVTKQSYRFDDLPRMDYGNKPSDGGNLIIEDTIQTKHLLSMYPELSQIIRQYVGSREFVNSRVRHCFWMNDKDVEIISKVPELSQRIEQVRLIRSTSKGKQSQSHASTPHRFVYTPHQEGIALIVPRVTSENRPYLPCGFVDERTIVADTAAVVYQAPIWTLAVVASRLHQQWISTVCVRLRTDYRYSNTLGWNTFPVPKFTEKNRSDLTHCAEEILLAREHYFPATIADMYDPDRMDSEFPLVRAAHDRNDEVLERIYIGRRFKNDTERLEKLFEMYTKMTR
ncbi:DNA methyltransferase (plasmid) [Synechococcus elongatus PCC 11801]|uniref:DNA methyltransferase n=1 Tax=Synechococcus elongatus PCC 11801 TaxID=2219813 RepID=A0ACD5A302_SYNEL